LGELPCSLVGEVTQSEKLVIAGADDVPVVEAALETLKEAWQKPLRW
ncbi:unnamed protein product, partial [marine sediment metagenome]